MLIRCGYYDHCKNHIPWKNLKKSWKGYFSIWSGWIEDAFWACGSCRKNPPWD